MRNIEKILLSAVLICLVIILCCLLTGCATARANRSVLKYQQQVDRLEEELRNRDSTIEAAIRDIRSIEVRSETVEGTVDEIIELFGEYQRRVEQLLQDYNNLRTKAKNTGPDTSNTVSNNVGNFSAKTSRRSAMHEADTCSPFH